jgi:putative FmdB family regulatory protein
MPLYEYECRSCGERFERLARLAGEQGTVQECPRCGAPAERVLSEFAVSSPASRQANIQRARQAWNRSRDRRDRRQATAEETKAHLRDDYGIAPPEKPAGKK